MDDLEPLVRNVLTEQFPNVSVERVVIYPDIDSDGDKFLRITVVLGGQVSRLDRDRLVGLVRHLKGRLLDANRDEFPLLSFVTGSEAGELNLESV